MTTDRPFAPPIQPMVLGIDPGIKGALAVLYPDGKVTVLDMPVVDDAVDCGQVCTVLRSVAPTFVVMERLWAIPARGPDGTARHNSASASFKKGRAYGAVEGIVVACGFPLHLVTPQKWKKYFGLDADKERSRMLAMRIWPSAQFGLKKHEGRAEAALIARYGAHQFGPMGALGAAA